MANNTVAEAPVRAKANKKYNTKMLMSGITDFLTKKYGTIDDSWAWALMSLEDTFARYIAIRDQINQEGITLEDGSRNPLLTTEKELLSTITKICKLVGCSPWDYARLLHAEKGQAIDDSEDFIEALTK